MTKGKKSADMYACENCGFHTSNYWEWEEHTCQDEIHRVKTNGAYRTVEDIKARHRRMKK